MAVFQSTETVKMRTAKDFIWLALLWCLCHSCKAARILAVVPVPSYSHQLAHRPLWKELSLRGHQVVLLTTDPMNDPSLTNLTEVDMHGAYKTLSQVNFGDICILSEHFAPFTMMQGIVDLVLTLQQYQHSLPEIQKLIENAEFDLVIAEYLAPSTIFYGELFDCPIIAITSMDAVPMLHTRMGNPIHPILYPAQDIAYSIPVTFKERLYQLIFRWIFDYYISSAADTSRQMLLNAYHKRNFPSYEEMLKRVEVAFINSNPVFHATRPLAPGTVNIFGLHILKSKPLPQDLQQFLDGATKGAIFVSFGTNVSSKELSGTNIIEILLETFRELPYKVIWKLDANSSHISSDKIMVREWYPQRDILAHKNVKLFITQGGLQSLEEALHCRVPMIGIPFLGDQFSNVLRAQNKGMGIVIYKNDLTEAVLKKSILEIIEEDRYKKRVTELADIIADRPMTALESAVWWTEYVLRHKGKDLSHLKGAAAHVQLHEHYMLDVITFLALIVLTGFFVAFWIVRVAIRASLNVSGSRWKQDKIKKIS